MDATNNSVYRCCSRARLALFVRVNVLSICAAPQFLRFPSPIRIFSLSQLRRGERWPGFTFFLFRFFNHHLETRFGSGGCLLYLLYIIRSLL